MSRRDFRRRGLYRGLHFQWKRGAWITAIRAWAEIPSSQLTHALDQVTLPFWVCALGPGILSQDIGVTSAFTQMRGVAHQSYRTVGYGVWPEGKCRMMGRSRQLNPALTEAIDGAGIVILA